MAGPLETFGQHLDAIHHKLKCYMYIYIYIINHIFVWSPRPIGPPVEPLAINSVLSFACFPIFPFHWNKHECVDSEFWISGEFGTKPMGPNPPPINEWQLFETVWWYIIFIMKAINQYMKMYANVHIHCVHINSNISAINGVLKWICIRALIVFVIVPCQFVWCVPCCSSFVSCVMVSTCGFHMFHLLRFQYHNWITYFPPPFLASSARSRPASSDPA